MLHEERTHTNGIPVDVTEERDLVREAVDAAVAKANGDLPAAAKLLERHAKADPDLFQLIAGPFLSQACWALMRQRATQERRHIWLAPHMDPQQKGERVQHLANENLRNWLDDFRLPIVGLPKLGDATKEQVQEGAEFYFRQAKTELRRGHWLAAIAGTLKGKRPVRAQLDNAEIERLAQQAQVEEA